MTFKGMKPDKMEYNNPIEYDNNKINYNPMTYNTFGLSDIVFLLFLVFCFFLQHF